VEDLIYSKAALFPSTPFTLKEDLSETLYYELKGLEREYVGVCALRNTKRCYPQGRVGADLIGYISSVNQQEYFTVASEMQELQTCLHEYEQGHLVFLPKGFNSFQEIKERLQVLKKNSYSLSDQSGKTGIEAKFDELLRGSYGKTTFEVNTKGSIVRMLPGSQKAIPGERILLNISAELQEFAEALLAENESIREKKFIRSGKDHHLVLPPWMKGGAIVAMIPTTGEIVALASYPRLDSNDFITSNAPYSQVPHWLENKTYRAQIWDGITPLEREFYSFTNQEFYKEEKKLTLERYLERILSINSPSKKAFQRINSLSAAVNTQRSVLFLLDLSEQPYMHALIDALYPSPEHHTPSTFLTNIQQIQEIQKALNQHECSVKENRLLLDKVLLDIPHNDDKLLVLDLLKLIAPAHLFDPELLAAVGQESLSVYRKLCQALAITEGKIKEHSKAYFHLHDFRKWRTEHFKTYLAQKRLEEKEQKRYQKPYVDYLKKLEQQQFQEFWTEHHWGLIALVVGIGASEHPTLSSYLTYFLDPSLGLFADPNTSSALDLLRGCLKPLDPMVALQYLQTMRSYRQLSDKLYGYYPQINKRKGAQIEQDLAAAFYPPSGYGHGRSYAFRQSTPLGSIFKIITAYEALKQNYERGLYLHTKDLNPLTIIDEIHPAKKPGEDMVLGFHEDGRKIMRRYKGGTLPRTHNVNLGKVDYIKAFERSSNIYFSLLAGDVIQEPNDLVMASLKFGFGNKTGIDLPGEIPGVLPKDLNDNRSGLYAFAIGQHSLIATPLQTAVMLSSLVNDGEVLKPQIIHLTAGLKPSPTAMQVETNYAYREYLNRIGIFFPFLLQTYEPKKEYDIKLFEKTLYRKVFLPTDIKEYLLEGLHSVISSPRGAARAELIRHLYNNTQAMKRYIKLKYQLAGKTSSAEVAYHPTLDRSCPPILCKDIWFGGISFQTRPDSSLLSKKQEEIPELVVVIYLKFGDFGKEAAPLAGEIVTKWREICQKQGKSSYFQGLSL
jgi:cell division protein FtsI/penicillin-binding protein 2